MRILDMDLSTIISDIKGISANSRKIKSGFAFVAIKGTLSDGHDYIQTAIDNGASLIISETLETHDTIPVYQTSNARKTLSKILAQLYPNRPERLYAVTGTNGKTSIADFIRQMIAIGTKRSVLSIGTLGAIAENVPYKVFKNSPFKVEHTTPDPEVLYPLLDYYAQNGVTDCIIEASSHGLDQERLAGLKFDCTLFTNFTWDHMDYHPSEKAYFTAKMKLFTQHTSENGTAIIFSDTPKYKDILEITKQHPYKTLTVGTEKADYIIQNFTPQVTGSDFDIFHNQKTTQLKTNFVGEFQSHNLTMALATTQQFYPEVTADIITKLKSVDGRLDAVAEYNGGAFYVDYAHTPDALEKALLSLKPHSKGKLICLFGCGGDRDTAKRPIMGKIASHLSDMAIVTDDNPRTEDATLIRQQIIKGMDKKSCEIIEIADRRTAIAKAVSLINAGDTVLVAGKGHENGQKIQDQTLPFKDARVIKQEINSLHKSLIMSEKKLLWTQSTICAITGGSVIKPFNITGISIDSRSVEPGDLFIPLKAKRDGHFFIKSAANAGASASLVVRKPRNIPRGFPIVYVKNTLRALEALGKAARNRLQGTVVAITGTCGKTTVKQILSDILKHQGVTHSSAKSLNNHLGVPLSLARMPADTEYGIFEIGMNHAGEITPLTKMVRPHIAVITTVGEGHYEAFNSVEDIARAKAEIIEGVCDDGTVILNKDIATYDILEKTSQDRSLNIMTFGTHEQANIRLVSYAYNEETEQATLEINANGNPLTIKTAFKGEHNALNICAIIAVLTAANADIPQAIEELVNIKPAAGRGEVLELITKDQGTIKLIDESYNANPLSMIGALKNMVPVKPISKDGKKIIVLGAMYELGDISEQAHASLKDVVIEGKYDAIYLIGKEMIPLYDALGEEEPAVLAETISDIADEIISVTPDGSVIMIKGSNGTKLSTLVEQFKQNSLKQSETKDEALPEQEADVG